MLELAANIKTFTEGTDKDSSEILAIHDAIMNADTLVSLGFAFHDLNMNLLTPNGELRGRRAVNLNVFGTANGISHYNLNVIRSKIKGGIWGSTENINFTDLNCKALFREYGLGISLAK